MKINGCCFFQAFESFDKRNSLERESRDKYLEKDGSGSGGSSSYPSPRMQSPRTHNRSVSHDSYFSLLDQNSSCEHPEGLKEEEISDSELSPESSKMFLEPELKVFSEDDTFKSTSLDDTLSRSTVDMESVSMESGCIKSKEHVSPRPEKTSLKDKFKRFTSPSSQRRSEIGVSDSSEDSRNNSLKRASTAIKEKIAQALSPETSRKRSESNAKISSPSSSPKQKHVRMVEEPSILDKSGFDSLLNSELWSCNKDKIAAEIHLEPDAGKESDDDRSHQSIESALIDPELLEKITHLRASPSVSVSEASSVSLAEATVSDNESFTLGSSSNGAHVNAVENRDNISYNQSSVLLPSNCTSSFNPPIAIVTENKLDPGVDTEKKDPLSVSMEDYSKYNLDVAVSNKRPTSLLGIPSSEVISSAGIQTSPETPQGDSTFIEIQYHPLSDTTEPSTPSESQFVSDLIGVSNDINKHDDIPPRQSSPLSPDLSSSSTDEPLENQPFYENVDAGISIPLTSAQEECEDSETKEYTISSLITSPDGDTSTVGGDDAEYENFEYGAEYENVQYGAEYENVAFTSENSNFHTKKVSQDDLDESYENINVLNEERLPKKVLCSREENYNPESQAQYENIQSNEIRHEQPECSTDPYEEVSFGDQHSISNAEASSCSSNFENTLQERSEAEIEGEMVYQQVRFLRKSIQEVNDILKEPNLEKNNKLENSDSHKISSNSLIELPVNVPQSSNNPNETSNENLHSEDSECLDSPVTPSSASLVTEVLVLPSFSSPTESTTDDITSPEASEALSSPQQLPVTGIQNNSSFQSSTSPGNVPQMFSSLSPPSPEPSGQGGSSQMQIITSILTPAPWPRSTSHSSIKTPVPKPRNLPKLNLNSPLQSLTSTPSSTSISPDSPATPGSPSGGSSAQVTPTDDYAPLPSLGSPDSTSPSFIEQPILLSTPTESTSPIEQDIHIESAELKLSKDFSSEPRKVICVAVNSSDIEQSTKRSAPQIQILHRFKSSPDFREKLSLTDKSEFCDVPHTSSEISVTRSQSSSGKIKYDIDDDEQSKRERIEKYKEERRCFFKEKYKSESFRGEKDELLLRLKQKATSPSRPDDEIGTEYDPGFKSISPRNGANSPEKLDCDVKIINQIENDQLLGRLNSQENVISQFNAPQDNFEFKKFQNSRKASCPSDIEFSKVSSSKNIVLNPFKSVSPKEPNEIIKSSKISKKDDIDEDVNVKERVAIWSRPQDKVTHRDLNCPSTKPEKIISSKKNDKKSKENDDSSPSTSLKNSPTAIRNGKSQYTRNSKNIKGSSSSPNKYSGPTLKKIEKDVQLSSAKSQKPPSPPNRNGSKNSITKTYSTTHRNEEASIKPKLPVNQNNSTKNSSTGNQGRIKDMAAIFERDSPTSTTKPIIVRQSSKEERKITHHN